MVKGRYQISRYCHTSYNDVGDISPLERDYLIGFITEELEKQQKALEEAKQNS